MYLFLWLLLSSVATFTCDAQGNGHHNGWGAESEQFHRSLAPIENSISAIVSHSNTEDQQIVRSIKEVVREDQSSEYARSRFSAELLTKIKDGTFVIEKPEDTDYVDMVVIRAYYRIM